MSAAMNSAIDHVLEAGSKQKIALEILATQQNSTAISFSQRKLDQFTTSSTQQIGVRVIEDGHEGVAYSESLERTALDEMLKNARENARMIQKDWISELHNAAKLPTMDFLFNPKLEQTAVERKIAAAQTLEAAALDFNSDLQSVPYSRYSDGSATVWIANTEGTRGSYKQNYCVGYASCLAKDGANSVMDGEMEFCRSFDSFSAEEVAKAAATKTLARRGAVRPQTGSYTVVFENRVAERLVAMLAAYFNGKAVDEDRSPLKGKLGSKLFASGLNLIDDPFYEKGAASRPFDEEGYAAQKTSLIENGVIKSFLTNSVLARKMKLPHTASASRSPSTDLDVSSTNLLVKPGTHDIAQLLNSDSKVLLVTGILGTAGYRPVSGDFSIPMEGFLYEQGKRVAPLKDFLISGNMLNLFANIEAIGNDVRRPAGSVVSPSMLIRGLNVAGQG